MKFESSRGLYRVYRITTTKASIPGAKTSWTIIAPSVESALKKLKETIKRVPNSSTVRVTGIQEDGIVDGASES